MLLSLLAAGFCDLLDLCGRQIVCDSVPTTRPSGMIPSLLRGVMCKKHIHPRMQLDQRLQQTGSGESCVSLSQVAFLYRYRLNLHRSTRLCCFFWIALNKDQDLLVSFT